MWYLPNKLLYYCKSNFTQKKHTMLMNK